MNRIKVHTRAAAVASAILLAGTIMATPATAKGRPRLTTITCGQTVTESIRVASE